jgi:hypothetical protein
LRVRRGIATLFGRRPGSSTSAVAAAGGGMTNSIVWLISRKEVAIEFWLM